ncbi:MAG: hypothetical protein IT426_03565 [Pirellulales bacterium]|nr:hypothetical protein [Pirellulales bacterium]
MSNEIHPPQTALKFEVTVQEHGVVEFSIPFSPGAKLAVYVVEENDAAADLIAASQSTLDFWDNSFDDEDWND